ncbi:MAG: GAP family protein [Mycobacterium sp.]
MLGEITALAMVVALSPFTVLPAIALVVHSDRPRATGLAFISGWLVAKAAITTLFVGVPRLMGGLQATPPHWTAWLRVAAGVAFILAALWYWRRPGAAAAEATWVDRLEHITPAAAAFVGVALTFLNPKLVFACAAAGFAIGSANLGAPATGAAIAYFTLLGGSTAVLPILAYMIWSHRVDAVLARFADWVRRHQVAITVAVLLLLGVALLTNGLRAL